MKFNQLESFLVIAELGSFAAAADRLFVTQSTISARIQELEASLGVQLFDRSQRSARLTLKGRELVEHARRITASVAEIRKTIGSPEALTGVIRIGVVEMVAITWLPDFVQAVRTKFPNIKLEFDVGLNPHIMDGLRKGSVDLAVVAGEPVEADMETLHLGTERFAWMAAQHLAEPGQFHNGAALEALGVLYQGEDSYTNRVIDGMTGPAGNRRRGTTCNSLGAIFAMARSGSGVGLLPIRLADGAGVQILETDPAQYDMPFSVIFAKNAPTLMGDIANLCVASSRFQHMAV